MLICVDGTGTGEGTIGDVLFRTKNRTANFDLQMMGSFVGMIYSGSHLPNRQYYRGPDWAGDGPNFAWPYDLYQQIREFWRQGDHNIFMTGYSRGAAIVINTAAMLGDKEHPMPDGTYARVEALFLFDAVARSIELPRSHYIPPSVKYCYHAMRNDSAHSRDSFGHCGTAMSGPDTFFVPRTFYTTHGGMGGVPWGERGLSASELKRDTELICKTYGPGPIRDMALERLRGESYITESFPDAATKVSVLQEKAGSDAVHDWMWRFLRKHVVL